MAVIGKRLKRTREAKGLSQRQLAAPGVSPAYISRIEDGDRMPTYNAASVTARSSKGAYGIRTRVAREH
jgi:transcriptional regulator with XRE-family HTH domain